MKKFLNLKIHWLISIPLLIIIFLYSSYLIGVKATAGRVFAGRITMITPLAICANPNTCAKCTFCGCGYWDERIIQPVFGQVPESSFYICTGAGFISFGNGGLLVGSSVLGYSSSPWVFANTGGSAPSTNVWSSL